METKGKIKLFFKDINFFCIQIQKNLSVTQKTKKTEFRTLETILSRYDADNNMLSAVTTKLSNGDNEILNAFGVSQALIDNVIFCHQEDSNWPLSEAKVLKTKFDEIFSATRYIKALDALRKVRLDKQNTLKHIENEKKHLEVYKDKANSLKFKLESSQSQYETLKTKGDLIQQKLSSIETKLETLKEDLSSIEGLTQKFQLCENEKKILEKQIFELSARMKNVFLGEDSDLEQNLNEFGMLVSNMENEIKQQQFLLDESNKQLDVFAKDKLSILTKIGIIEKEEDSYNLNSQKFKHKFDELAKIIGLTCTSIEICLLNNFNTAFTEFKENFEKETNEILLEQENSESLLEKEINENRDTRSKLNQTITILLERIQNNKKEIEKLSEEINYIKSSKDLLIDLGNEITLTQSSLEDKIDILNSRNFKSEIQKLEEQKSSLNEHLNSLNNTIDELHEMQGNEMRLQIMKDEINSKKNLINRILMENKNELSKFFGDFDLNLEIDNSSLRNQFDIEYQKLKNDIEEKEVFNKVLSNEIITIESESKVIKDDIQDKKTLLNTLETQLRDFVDVGEFEQKLIEVQESLKNCIDEKGFLNGVDKTYKRFIKQLSSNSDNHSCPVCYRDFNNTTEVEHSILNLEKFNSKLPIKLKEVDAKILEISEKQDKMLKIKNSVQQYRQIKDIDLPLLSDKIKNLEDSNLRQKKQNLYDHECQIETLKKKKRVADSLNDQLIVIQKYKNEIDDLQKELQNETYKLKSSKILSHNLDELRLQRISLLNKLEETKFEYESISVMKTEAQQEIQNLKEKLSQLKIGKLELELKAKNYDSLNERFLELNAENNINESKIEQYRKEAELLEFSISKKTEDKIAVSKKRFKIREDRRTKLNDIDSMHRDISELAESIKTFESINQLILSKARENLKKITNQEAEVRAKCNNISLELTKMKDELSRKELMKHELQELKHLRYTKEEFNNKTKYLNTLIEKLNKYDVVKIKKAIEHNTMEKENFLKHMNEIQSKMSGLGGQINMLTSELDTNEYRDADGKFKTCVMDFRVIEISLKDIEKYYKALDAAIMNYHNMKMNEINASIKQLWKSIVIMAFKYKFLKIKNIKTFEIVLFTIGFSTIKFYQTKSTYKTFDNVYDRLKFLNS